MQWGGEMVFKPGLLSRRRDILRSRGYRRSFYLAEALEQRCLLSAATQLAFVQQPSTAVVGTPISPNVTVDVQDSGGNLVTTDNSNVTIAFSIGPAGASLAGTLTAQAHNGVATFTNLSATAAGSYILEAFDSNLAPATSSEFTVLNASLQYHLIFSQQPTAAPVGAALNPFVVVQDVDQFGNINVNDDSTVTLSLAGSTFGAALGGTTSENMVNGVASFNDVWTSSPGVYSLNASDGTLTPALSNDFVVSGAGYSISTVAASANGLVNPASPPHHRFPRRRFRTGKRK
jgi:hypothetical protein